jgi:shikimate dehydrogenase
MLDAIRAAGGTAFGGIGLLLEQAAIAFELWTGQPAPVEVMSAAALAARGLSAPA